MQTVINRLLMANHSIQRKEIDVIALETKHQQEFQRSQVIQEFSDNYRDNPRDTFADGSVMKECIV